MTAAELKLKRIEGVVQMAEEWAVKQLLPEGQLCMAAVKDIRRILREKTK